MAILGPRLVIAGTHSGVGKTTVAIGLMAAFARRGRNVTSAKIGPDFIDPGYHRVATGRAGRSLDAWLLGDGRLRALAAAGGGDLLVIEGVMGLFDGSGQPGCDGSTGAVARLLDAPVILVVDAAAMSNSVAALVHGYRDFDPSVRVEGVILNRVGGEGHARLLRDALAPLGVPVLGALPDDAALHFRERHLGLVPVVEQRPAVDAAMAQLTAAIDAGCDLAAIVALAECAPRRHVPDPPRARQVVETPVRVAVAAGPAFDFVYPENLSLLAEAGAELVPFDPLRDAALPEDCHGLYAGGGFPEVFAAELGANVPMLSSVRHALRRATVAWAECGGLLWLCRSLDGVAMSGVIAADAAMTERLTIGYRTAVTTVATPFGAPGTELRGHEFHRSNIAPPGGALQLRSPTGRGAAGHGGERLLASYLHQHLAGAPWLAESFVRSCAAARMAM